MDRNTRLEVLALMHEVYARNTHVRMGGKMLRFEPRDYHLGMAALYRSRKHVDQD